MLNLSFMRCEACTKPFAFRMGVGAGDQQAFVCQCPHCGAALHGILHADQRRVTLRFESEDMAEIPARKAQGWESWPGVTVYTDLPVHLSCIGKGMKDGGSAFLALNQFMPEDVWLDYNERVTALNARRLRLIPALRRVTAHFIAKDWAKLSKALALALPEELPEVRHSFHAVMSELYLPLFPSPMMSWADEVRAEFRGVASNALPEWVALRSTIDGSGFRQFRRQVVDTAIRAFQKSDALSSAIAYECLPGRDASEFKIFRDDLDVLKSLYVDLFELASRGLAFLGTVVNLHRRGHPEKWSDGKTWTLSKMLNARAVDREFIASELPACGQLYAGVRRHTRNNFGHCKIHYDIATGCLVDEEGHEENFLLFLADLLGAVRCSALTLLLVKCVDEEPQQPLSPNKTAP